MTSHNEESLRRFEQDVRAMAASLDISVTEAEAILSELGSTGTYPSSTDSARALAGVKARINKAAKAERSAQLVDGIVEPLNELAAFVVKCLAKLLSPAREAVALGPSHSVVDAIKEMPLPQPLQTAVPWLKERGLEIYRAGQTQSGTRYGVRVVPRVAGEDAVTRLRVTLCAADGKSASLVLTSDRATRLFDGGFPADWSGLSLEVRVEDEHGHELSAALPTETS